MEIWEENNNMQRAHITLLEMAEDVPFAMPRRIGFGETDAARIVYTVRFFDYAIDAIDAWFDAIAGASFYVLNTEYDISCPFVHAELDFQAPLRPGDDLVTQVFVERLGRSSLTFRVRGALRGGRPCFAGRFTVSFIAPSLMKAIPVPPELAARVELYQARCAAWSLAQGEAAADGRGVAQAPAPRA